MSEQTGGMGRPPAEGMATPPAGSTGAPPTGGAGTPPAGTDAGNTGPGADGSEPDARFTFANERTFLAWSRTSLALVVGGLAIVQLLPPFPGVPWGRHVIGTPLILLGGAVSVISYLEWKANQQALRHGQPVRRSHVPQFLAIAIAVIALAAVMLAVLSGVRAS